MATYFAATFDGVGTLATVLTAARSANQVTVLLLRRQDPSSSHAGLTGGKPRRVARHRSGGLVQARVTVPRRIAAVACDGGGRPATCRPLFDSPECLEAAALGGVHTRSGLVGAAPVEGTTVGAPRPGSVEPGRTAALVPSTTSAASARPMDAGRLPIGWTLTHRHAYPTAPAQDLDAAAHSQHHTSRGHG